MFQQKSLPVRVAVTSLIAGVVALMSACAIDPTDGIRSGPSGGMGVECKCPGGSADCDGDQAQCNAGLDCRRTDNNRNICTVDCGGNAITGSCPYNYVCRALGIPGTRLSCHPTP